MALARICDICWQLYEAYEIDDDSKGNGIAIITIHNNSNCRTEERFDLCPKCMDSIKDLIKTLKN